MTKVTNLEEMEKENSIPQILIGNAHKLFQASLGAAMLVQDEVVHLADKLIEQGEATESKSRKRVDEFVDGRKKETNGKLAAPDEYPHPRRNQYTQQQNHPSDQKSRRTEKRNSLISKQVLSIRIYRNGADDRLPSFNWKR